MGFYSRDQIEDVFGKRQLRDTAFPNLDPADLDPLLVYLAGYGEALFGMIDTVDPSFGGGGQLAHRSASATTDVEDTALDRYRNVRQPPIGDFRVPRIHVPQSESPEQSRGLLALIDPCVHS